MAGKDVTRVVNRCDQAKEDNRLDLSSCDLTQIPDAIFLLMRSTTLESCNLSDNLIRRIPSKFAVKFSSLTELRLRGNHLSSLPDELRQMEQLVKMDISHNRFSVLPPVVYRMESLKVLNAEHNSIKDVDVSHLKRLPNLSQVNLQDNPLTEEVHSQLLAADGAISFLLTPSDPELDSVD